MAERIVEVGVPPRVKKEITDYHVIGDPLVSNIILSESARVMDHLAILGYLKTGDAIRVVFVANSDVELNSPVRSATMFDAVMDADGRLLKFGDPVAIFQINTPINTKN